MEKTNQNIGISSNGTWVINGEDTLIKATGDNGKSAYEVAVENGFVGTQAEWLISLQGVSGKDGETPYIGGNRNWYIGDVDTQVKAEGIQGPMGPQGATGPQGIQGVKGETGAAGANGAKGETGATGPQGIQGVKGETGATGLQGIQGPKGNAGATGPQGIQGPKGNIGATGPQGIQGPKGDTGSTGSPGIQGPKGDKGATGAQGPAGPVKIANNLLTTAAGDALDARQGKILNERGDMVEIGSYQSRWRPTAQMQNIGNKMGAQSTDSLYTTAGGGRIIVRKSGVYLINLTADLIGNADVNQVYSYYIKRNGAIVELTHTHYFYGATHCRPTCTSIVYLNAGDYLEAFLALDAGNFDSYGFEKFRCVRLK